MVVSSDIPKNVLNIQQNLIYRPIQSDFSNLSAIQDGISASISVLCTDSKLL